MLNSTKGLATTLFTATALALSLCVFTASAQTGSTGSVNITVIDPTGASIPDAALELKDVSTNDVRKAVTQQNGTYTFPDLPFGNYQLTILAKVFQRQVFESVR